MDITPPSLNRASSWVEAAITTGLNPLVVQNSLHDEDSGKWRIAVRRMPGANRVELLPDEYFDEAELILEGMGRIKADSILRCWHGEVLIDDCSERDSPKAQTGPAVPQYRRNKFFEAWQVLPGLIEDDPDTSQALSNLIELAVSDLSRRDSLPKVRLFSGTAEEIER